jgi:hypothetical protein
MISALVLFILVGGLMAVTLLGPGDAAPLSSVWIAWISAAAAATAVVLLTLAILVD